MRISALATVVIIFTGLAAASVSVSSPTSGSTVSSSVHVASTSSSTHSITKTIVYVDNNSAYSVASGSVDTYLTIASGGHTIVVQSWDSAGTVLKSAGITFTVSATSSTVPSNAKVYASIDQMTGWSSCDSCAGAGGSGPSTTYSLTQNISSPSMDGKSAQFYLKPSQPYANALWWKQLGANSAVSNFQYDLYFYLKSPSAAQALEFDLNQSLNGKKYIFGTQCDIKDHHDWDVYDAANHKWVQTGVACSAPTAYTWNHLTLEFQRTNGQVKFVAVTLNGKKSYFNKSYYPASSSASELNVAVQLDGNGTSTAYDEWADKINLSAW
jgi:hypothetical protein